MILVKLGLIRHEYDFYAGPLGNVGWSAPPYTYRHIITLNFDWLDVKMLRLTGGKTIHGDKYGTLSDEVIDWLGANDINWVTRILRYDDQFAIEFETKKAAMWFKMRWLI